MISHVFFPSDRNDLPQIFPICLDDQSPPEALGRRTTNRRTNTRTIRKGTRIDKICLRTPLLTPFPFQRDALLAQLTRLLDSESALTASALKQNNLTRHRDVLSDHKRELTRLRTSISTSRDRQHLLSHVRSDIDSYHRASNPEQAEAEYMLQERGRIDNSHNMMDSVLAQAYAVNESFAGQRETLASINRRIVGAASQVPGMNAVIGRIGAKRRRDGLILGGFIAFCVLVVFFLR
jgi:golgi SNAP receptor complex member 1